MKVAVRKIATATVILLVLLTAAYAGPAEASHVDCGQVITQSTVLDRSIGPCPNEGVVIGADNVTLDLNGHAVLGTPAQGEGAGILLEGRTGVRVQNGAVSGFDAGVALVGGSRNTVADIWAISNVGSGATDFGDGIAVSGSSDNHIVRNLVVHNGPFSGIGLFGARSTGNTIEENRVEDNNVQDPTEHHGDPAGSMQDDGIRLEPGTSRNTVRSNVVHNNGLDGIAVFARSTDNVIRHNIVGGNGFHMMRHRKGDGIAVFNLADRNVIEANRVFFNAANGIFLRGPTAAIAGAMSNLVLSNATGNNNFMPDPDRPAFDLHDGNPNCDHNVWSANTFGTASPDCTKA